MFICKFCLSERKSGNSLHQHSIRCLFNPDRIFNNGKKGKKGGNIFTKARKEGTEVPAHPCKGSPGNRGYKHSQDYKDNLSKIARKRGIGGVSQSRRIKYKGKTLGSSYELSLAEDLDKNNIKWDICKRIPYTDPNGKQRTYTPDIYLVDYNVYLDPKNDFLLNNVNPGMGFTDKEKIQMVMVQNNIKVVILNKDQLTWEEVKKFL